MPRFEPKTSAVEAIRLSQDVTAANSENEEQKLFPAGSYLVLQDGNTRFMLVEEFSEYYNIPIDADGHPVSDPINLTEEDTAMPRGHGGFEVDPSPQGKTKNRSKKRSK